MKDLNRETDSSERTLSPEARGDREAGLKGAGEAVDDDTVFSIIADVEAQLSRIRAAHSAHETQIDTLEDRARTIEAREELLGQRESEIAEREDAVKALEAGLKQARKEAEQQSRAAYQRSREIEEQERTLDEHTQRIEKQIGALKQREQQVAQQKEKLAADRKLLDEHWDEFNAERARLSGVSEKIEKREKEAGRELEAARTELARTQQALAAATEARDKIAHEHAREHHTLVQQHSALKHQNETLKHQLAEQCERTAKAEHNVGDLIAQLEAAQSAMESTGGEHETLKARAADLKEKQAKLERALAEKEKGLAARTKELAAAQNRIEKIESECESLREQLESGRSDAGDKARALEEAEARIGEFDQQVVRLEENVNEAIARAERAEAERAELAEQAQQEQMRLQKALEEATHKAQRREERMNALQGEVEDGKKIIAEQRQTLKTAKEKLAGFAKAIGEQTEQIKRGAEAIATVREQAQQIERLKQQLAKAQLSGNPEELMRKEERIHELTQALRQARGQSMSDDDVAERDQRIETLQSELDNTKAQLEHARIEVKEAHVEVERARTKSPDRNNAESTALKARVQELEAALASARAEVADGQTGAQEEVAALNRRIRELEAGLASAENEIAERQSGERDEIAAMNRRVRELESELSKAKSEAQTRESATEETKMLRAQIATLKKSLAEAEQRAKHAQAQAHEAKAQAEAHAEDGASPEVQAQLEKKSRQIRYVADHLRRRRARLIRVRQLLREAQRNTAAQPQLQLDLQSTSQEQQSSPRTNHKAMEEQMRIAAKLQREQQSLRETARLLAESEKKMIRKWARPRAVITATWFFIMVGLLAAGSWFAADHFKPATVSAYVTLVATPKPGSELDANQRAQWQAWHSERLVTDTFLRAAAKRFSDRQMIELGDPGRLRKFIDDSLKIESAQDGEMTLKLHGTDRQRLQLILDTLATTLDTESRAQAGHRPDGARTAIANERKEGGVTMYAAIDKRPIADERLKWAQYIFGGSLAFALFIIGFAYVRLSRSRRVFDEELRGLDGQAIE